MLLLIDFIFKQHELCISLLLLYSTFGSHSESLQYPFLPLDASKSYRLAKLLLDNKEKANHPPQETKRNLAENLP